MVGAELIDMKRGTPAAQLFGGLLRLVRTVGSGQTTRDVADGAGVQAAFVSQVENGQRALKRPRLSAWAAALGVNEGDLTELWFLAQGFVPAGEALVEYTSALDVSPRGADVRRAVRDRPEHKHIYVQAQRIADVLRRALPEARVQVDPDDFSRFQDERDLERERLGEPRETVPELEADFLELPFINVYEDGFPRYGVGVPLLETRAGRALRSGPSAASRDLEGMIRRLTPSERERVRGYVDAILELRSSTPSLGRAGA